jgi:hypothetical protein
MKGNISSRLSLILRNEGARSQLRRFLQIGRDGTIRLDGRVFRLRVQEAPRSNGAFARSIAK